jgi:hypothetical protein
MVYPALLPLMPHTSAGRQSTELTPPPGWFKWTRPLCAKDEVWFLRMCLHISNAVICCTRPGLAVSVWVGCILCVMFVSFEKMYINWQKICLYVEINSGGVMAWRRHALSSNGNPHWQTVALEAQTNTPRRTDILTDYRPWRDFGADLVSKWRKWRRSLKLHWYLG